MTTEVILERTTATIPANLENATIRAIQKAIKDHVNPDGINANHKGFSLKKHIIKVWNPKERDPENKQESFARALYHNNKRLNRREDAIELFILSQLESEGLEQRGGTSTKAKKLSGLAAIIIPGICKIVERDNLAQATLKAIGPGAKLSTTKGWNTFFEAYPKKRAELEQLAENCFEFAGVNIGDTAGIEAKLLGFFPTYEADIGAFDWTDSQCWANAEHNLRAKLGQ